MKYYIIHNQTEIYIAENEQAFSNLGYTEEVHELPEDYNSEKYLVVDGELILNTNYDQEQAEKEQERVNSLTCTKRVFALILTQLGVTYTQLKELIAQNERAQLEWDLCVELQRSNPLLDVMASQLGFTHEQLDKIFKYANGEINEEELLN